MGESVTYSNNIIHLPYQKLQAIKKDYVMTLAIYTRLWYIIPHKTLVFNNTTIIVFLIYSPTTLINRTVPDLAYFPTSEKEGVQPSHLQNVSCVRYTSLTWNILHFGGCTFPVVGNVHAGVRARGTLDSEGTLGCQGYTSQVMAAACTSQRLNVVP